jgi:hypothetical protein
MIITYISLFGNLLELLTELIECLIGWLSNSIERNESWPVELLSNLGVSMTHFLFIIYLSLNLVNSNCLFKVHISKVGLSDKLYLTILIEDSEITDSG